MHLVNTFVYPTFYSVEAQQDKEKAG